MPVSAVDSISPAFRHATDQLFRPFRFGQWTRLAMVGLFAGELSTAGGCNFNIPSTTVPDHHHFRLVPNLNPALLIPLLIVAAIAVPLLWLLFLYVSSRMRFVLFDSIIARNCSVGQMWRARRGPGLQYFVWQIVLSLIALGGLAVILGVPSVLAFLLGWFTQPREHLLSLVLVGMLVLLAFFGWTILILLVHVFSKDFVVPQMALENLSAFDGWARLLTMLRNEKGRYAGYAGMKLILAMGAAIALGIVAVILVLVLLVPIGGLGILSILLAQAAGLTWNLFTITIGVSAACILLLVLLYGVSLISVPMIVFFPAYSIYFFSARYPLLANLLYPAPAGPASPVGPGPEPIG